MSRAIIACIALVVSSLVGFCSAIDPLFSPSYFWMWNDKLELPTLIAQLEDMHEHGLRNVCIHPFPKTFRPGLFSSNMEPEYMSEEYLKVFAAVVKRADELGMHAYMYDEGGWPSGGAGGLVAATDKDGKLCPRQIRLNDDGQPIVVIKPYDKLPPYPSIIEKGTTEKFIEITHDAYAKAFPQQIGGAVKIAFTDEPQRPGGRNGELLGWTSDFAEVFKAKKGYDILPHIPEMLKSPDVTDDRLAQLRIDYNDVMGDLFVERFLLPIKKWCHNHNMLSGGHVNGEDLPERNTDYGHGNLLRTFRAMDVPGVDVIWRQLFPKTRSQEAITRPFPRYASSVMHQQGGKYALSESFGIYGDASSPMQMKWLVDYQLVRGINTFVFGYYAQSYAKQWRLLFGPHSGPIAPYWDMESAFFKYIERTAAFLSQGRPGAEIAVLYDVRGFWAGGADREAAVWSHYATANALDRLNTDYDFCDDESIAMAEVLSNGRLRVGKMEYRAIVLPSKKWMLKSAKDKLEQFAKAGGVVIDSADIAKLPRTLALTGVGPGVTDFRVMKRIDGKRNIYFVMNEYAWPHEVKIDFSEGGNVVRYDPITDKFTLVSENGRVKYFFEGGETAIYITGDVPSADKPIEFEKDEEQLTDGWTLQKLTNHIAKGDDLVVQKCDDQPVSVELGDWRKLLGGGFSGKALYRTKFVARKSGVMKLNLGEVKWCASVKIDGKDLGPRFFVPYEWTIDISAGEHEIEVTVANLLSNYLGQEAVRNRINSETLSSGNYERYQSVFDCENHDSGLYGPVTIKYAK